MAARPVRLAEAQAQLRRMLAGPSGREMARLAEAAGRVLAAPVTAATDLPHRDAAAVDGFAARRAALGPQGARRLRLSGTAAAGHPHPAPLGPGEAVRVYTGAMMPDGADIVLMEEQCRVVDGHVVVPEAIPAKGNWRRQGEDFARGAEALPAGLRLRPEHLAIAAALGHTELAVHRRPRVTVFSNGDELRPPGAALPAGAAWDANRPFLGAALAALGCAVTDGGILPDGRAAVEAALVAAAQDSDLLVSSGGMSVGSADHMRAVIRRRGSLDLWPLAVKPGKPVGVGDIDDCPILALPGNPAAAIVTFVTLGRSVVLRLAGARDEPPPALVLPARFRRERKPGWRELLFARLAPDAAGASGVALCDKQGAAMLSGFGAGEGFAVLAEEAALIAPGDPLPFLPFAALLA